MLWYRQTLFHIYFFLHRAKMEPLALKDCQELMGGLWVVWFLYYFNCVVHLHINIYIYILHLHVHMNPQFEEILKKLRLQTWVVAYVLASVQSFNFLWASWGIVLDLGIICNQGCLPRSITEAMSAPISSSVPWSTFSSLPCQLSPGTTKQE